MGGKDVAEKDGSWSIVQAVVSIAKSRNIATTAEGVETQDQLRLVLSAGCNQVQGYLFGRPGPAEALPWLQAMHRSA